MAVAFDTLQFVRNLTRAGLPEAQAEVFANAHRDAFKEALDSNLATKGDIAELRSEMAEFRAEMAEFRESTNSQIAEFKEFIMAEINQLKRRDDHLQGQISHLKWIMIFNLGFTVTIMWKVFS